MALVIVPMEQYLLLFFPVEVSWITSLLRLRGPLKRKVSGGVAMWNEEKLNFIMPSLSPSSPPMIYLLGWWVAYLVYFRDRGFSSCADGAVSLLLFLPVEVSWVTSLLRLRGLLRRKISGGGVAMWNEERRETEVCVY
jgi:hypothetical protein